MRVDTSWRPLCALELSSVASSPCSLLWRRLRALVCGVLSVLSSVGSSPCSLLWGPLRAPFCGVLSVLSCVGSSPCSVLWGPLRAPFCGVLSVSVHLRLSVRSACLWIQFDCGRLLRTRLLSANMMRSGDLFHLLMWVFVANTLDSFLDSVAPA